MCGEGISTPCVRLKGRQPLIKCAKSLKQSNPARALDRILHEDWARDAREGPRVLMSLRVDFRPMG